MKGFDCNCKLTFEKALKFKQDGYRFVIRYVGRLKQSPSLDLDKVETNDILRAGLMLGVVQHCPPDPGIIPTKELGATYGRNATTFAREAGYKEGCILYLDLEDVKPGSKKQDIIDFCNYWFQEVAAAGYTPGVYIGFDVFLTPEELYHQLKFQHYWKALSKVPEVATRGYEMVQAGSPPVNDMSIDVNTVIGDNMGNTPVFMEPDKVLVHTIKVYNDGSCVVE